MCGGRGTRLSVDVEKPLLPVGGRPMVDRVLDALAASAVEERVAAVSPHASDTAAHVGDRVPTVETPGEGYVADLDRALDDPRIDRPVLTVVADLPLLDGPTVDRVLAAQGRRAEVGETRSPGSLAVCVPVARKRRLGASVDTAFDHDGRRVAPTGLNVVAGGADDVVILDVDELAVNVNRLRDARVAEALCD
jgi:adenosylcobinamide-phosphate guanylyltransferase